MLDALDHFGVAYNMVERTIEGGGKMLSLELQKPERQLDIFERTLIASLEGIETLTADPETGALTIAAPQETPQEVAEITAEQPAPTADPPSPEV